MSQHYWFHGGIIWSEGYKLAKAIVCTFNPRYSPECWYTIACYTGKDWNREVFSCRLWRASWKQVNSNSHTVVTFQVRSHWAASVGDYLNRICDKVSRMTCDIDGGSQILHVSLRFLSFGFWAFSQNGHRVDAGVSGMSQERDFDICIGELQLPVVSNGFSPVAWSWVQCAHSSSPHQTLSSY